MVTIGIPTHNRSALLVRALRSALAQTHRDIQVVISDDASSDDTPQRVRDFDDPRITLVRFPTNVGIATNYNNCLQHAKGELLLMLNDDDELEPTAIDRLSRPLTEPTRGLSPERIGVAWCPCLVQDPQRNVKWITQAGPPVESGLDAVVGLFDGTRGPRFCGVMVRTDDARAVGGYSAEHGPIPDVGNWTKVALRREFAACIPDPLARYTAHGSSCTGTSSPKSWQKAGECIHGELADYLRSTGDRNGLRRLESARRNFICGLLVTVLMQAMGRPGWVKLALREFLRSPHYFLTPMVARRLVKDGPKLLRRRS